MLNAKRVTYLKLMKDIEDLEDKIEKLEEQNPEAPGLEIHREELAEQRNELARISDGCGVPHPH